MRLPSLSAVPQTFLCSGAQTWANLLLLPPQLNLSPSPPSPCLFTAPPPSNLSVPFNFPQPPERRTHLNHSPLLFFSRRLSGARVHVRGSAAPLRRFARAPFRSLCKRRSRRQNKKPEPHLRARRKKREERGKAVQYNATTSALKTGSEDICCVIFKSSLCFRHRRTAPSFLASSFLSLLRSLSLFLITI